MDQRDLMGVRGELTVNASSLAVPFYRELGFEITGPRSVLDGVWSTPMSRI